MDFEKYIDSDILSRFEFYNYGHALEILCDAFPVEWQELQESLRRLQLTLEDIRTAGGNESPIPKKFDDVLYPYGWREIRFMQIHHGSFRTERGKSHLSTNVLLVMKR